MSAEELASKLFFRPILPSHHLCFAGLRIEATIGIGGRNWLRGIITMESRSAGPNLGMACVDIERLASLSFIAKRISMSPCPLEEWIEKNYN